MALDMKHFQMLVLANGSLKRAKGTLLSVYEDSMWPGQALFPILLWGRYFCHHSYYKWDRSLAYNEYSEIQRITALKLSNEQISAHFLVHRPPRATYVSYSSRSAGLNWRKCLNMGTCWVRMPLLLWAIGGISVSVTSLHADAGAYRLLSICALVHR